MSIKKLQELLSPNLPPHKDPNKILGSAKQSPQLTENPPINNAPGSVNNLNNPQKLNEMPNFQNLFYHPKPKKSR